MTHSSQLTTAITRCLAITVTLCVCAGAAQPAQAAITVNTTADPGASGQCSLRKAIEAANTQAPAGDCAAADPSPSTTTINLPAGHYTLLSELEITGSARVLLQGASSADASQTVIDGAHRDRVLMVDSGANAGLDGLTVTGGKTADGASGGCCGTNASYLYNPHSGTPGYPGGDGGGIYNSGTLTVTNAAITGNSTGRGGDGGAGGHGDPSAWNGGPGGDGANGGNGGGIYNDYFATLSLTNTTVSDNHTGSGGRGGQGGSGATSPPPNPCTTPCGGVQGSVGGAGGPGGPGGYGGGIEDYGAQLTLTNSTVSANTTGPGGDAGGGGLGGPGAAGDSSYPGGGGGAGGAGGGDNNVQAGSGGLGGGIDDRGQRITVTGTTISANVAGNGGHGGLGGGGGNGAGAAGGAGGPASKGGTGGSGGGMTVGTYTGLAITNSTLAGNDTGAGGNGGAGGSGGFGSTRGPAVPGADGGSGGSGGAIFTRQGTLSNVTVAGNQTAPGGLGGPPGQGCQPGDCFGSPAPAVSGSGGLGGAGGGIYSGGAPGMSLANTLLASNHVPGAVQNCAVPFGSPAIGDGGHNLSYPDASCPGITADPVLGPLQSNGGPTQTMALGTGSAAIDQIPQGSSGCPGADQRGVARPYPAGGLCDIGAFEAGPPSTAAPGPPSAAITTPADGASYSFGANVNASYSCSPGANGGVLKSGAAGCSGPVPNGSPIDTSSAGAHTFTVTATDTDGQTASATSHYTVQSPPPVTHTLSVTKSGGGSGVVSSSPAGIDCGGTCSHAYGEGTSVALTATPAAGSTFAGWSGGGCAGGGACTVTMSSDKTVSAAFDQAPVPVAAPGPPSARITTPADGESYPFGSTVNANYSCSPGVNGALKPGASGCSGSVPNGSPIDTLTSGTHTFTVTATDTDGQISTTTTHYTLDYTDKQPPPVRPQRPLRTVIVNPRVDIRVTGIEVTQGIQDIRCNCAGTLPNRLNPFATTPGRATYEGVTMAAGKYTIVRVYAHFTGIDVPTATRLPGATARLRIFDSSEREISPELTPDFGPAALTPPDCLACVTEAERANARAAFEFLIPWQDTYHRTLTFRATVSPPIGLGGAVQCGGCNANVFTLRGVPFATTADVPIYPIPLTVGGVATSETVDDVFDSTQTVLPVNVSIYPYEAPLAVDGMNQNQAIAAVDLRALSELRTESQYPVGVFVSGGLSGSGGLTLGGRNLYGAGNSFHRLLSLDPPISIVSDDRPLTSAMHEIGHGLGLVHADIAPHPDGTPDCGGSGEAWPPDNEGRIQGTGFDLRNWTARILDEGHPAAGSTYYDFMSYCPGRGGSILGTSAQFEANHWISVRNWSRLIAFHPPAQALPAAVDAPAARASAADAGSLRVIATVDSGGATSIFDVETGAQTYANPTAGTPYRFELRDAAGATLASVAPATESVHNDGGRPGLVLMATLPLVPSATAVVVSADGVELARRPRSAHAPTAVVISPRPGTRIGRSARTLVRWRARDRDGDRLTTTVDYSADGGRHWKVVASGADGDAAQVPSRLLSASRNARFRVRVSDGFDVATAVSGSLRAAGAPPFVHIIGGRPRSPIRADAMLLLHGAAYDDAGTPLTGRSLRWYAGRRLLGHGELLTVPGLPAGTASVRLVATDRSGRSSQARLPLRVLPVPPTFLVARAPTHVAATARRLRIVIASTVPAVLTIGGGRYRVDRKSRAIAIAIRPGRGPLRLKYLLSSPGGVTGGTYVAAR